MSVEQPPRIALEELRLGTRSELVTPSNRHRRRDRAGEFLAGPIPFTWLSVAAQLPGRALHVGLLVWHRSRVERVSQVSLTAGKREGFGLDRHATSRALSSLEKAGLVSVMRRPGCAPVVQLINEEGAE